MELTKILAITGKPGLYELIKETKNGFIVESLEDGKRFPVFSNTRVSSLEEISIFSTGEDDIALRDIFKAIKEKEDGSKSIDPKSDNDTLREYFLEVAPDYDEERVYISDIKKVILWYNILAEKEMLDFEEDGQEEDGETGSEDAENEGENNDADDKDDIPEN
jgi:hypothetical protein